MSICIVHISNLARILNHFNENAAYMELKNVSGAVLIKGLSIYLLTEILEKIYLSVLI